MLNTTTIEINRLDNELLKSHGITLDILRLDNIHNQISGNKYFKLYYNVEHAIQHQLKGIVSFGGAYSNHLHALAYAGNKLGIKTAGIVRGDEVMNDTLQDCKHWGMNIHFVSREEYKKCTSTNQLPLYLMDTYNQYYILPEGGANALGIKGCKEILNNIQIQDYDYIAVSVGTATTLIGLLESTNKPILGFTAFKNNAYMYNEIAQHTSNKNYTLIDKYSLGGFGKMNSALQLFMQLFMQENGIALDRIYTAKMLYGLYAMINENEIKPNEKILAIHTGGLQGNRSIF